MRFNWLFENTDNVIVNALCLCYTMAVDTDDHKFQRWGQRMTMEWTRSNDQPLWKSKESMEKYKEF